MAGTKGRKMGHIIGEKLLESQSMKDWFESLNYCAISRGKTQLTIASKRQRLGNMLKFTSFSNMNPDELLTEGKKDINLSGKRLMNFFNAGIEEGNSRNTMATKLSFLRGFYSHNNLSFPKKWRIPSRTKSQIKGIDEQKPMFKRNGNGEVELKTTTLQKFIQTLNFRDQTVSLCLLSTGADANDILALNFDFVKNLDDETDRILLSGNRIKDNIEFRVYLSQEATQFLKRYVRQVKAEQKENIEENKKIQKVNKKILEENEKLILKKELKKLRSCIVITDKTPLFFINDSSHGNFGKRLTVQALSGNFRDGAKKIGDIKEGELNSLRPKRFRHLFKNACNYAEINDGWVNSMMGHKSNVSQNYLEKSILMLEVQYEKIEKFVTVFGVGKIRFDENIRENKELKAKIYKLGKSDVAIFDEINQLKAKLESKEKYLKIFEGIIKSGELADFREWLEMKYAIEAQENEKKEQAEIIAENPIAKKIIKRK